MPPTSVTTALSRNEEIISCIFLYITANQRKLMSVFPNLKFQRSAGATERGAHVVEQDNHMQGANPCPQLNGETIKSQNTGEPNDKK